MRRRRRKIHPVRSRPTRLAGALRKIHPVLSRPMLLAGGALGSGARRLSLPPGALLERDRP